MRQAKPKRRQAMLFDAGHFAKGARMSVRHERRVVAEARSAAWWPHQRAVGACFDFFEMTVGPGNAERGDEMGLALGGRGCTACLQQALDSRHRAGEVLVGSGPARRIDSGRAV